MASTQEHVTQDLNGEEREALQLTTGWLRDRWGLVETIFHQYATAYGTDAALSRGQERAIKAAARGPITKEQALLQMLKKAKELGRGVDIREDADKSYRATGLEVRLIEAVAGVGPPVGPPEGVDGIQREERALQLVRAEVIDSIREAERGTEQGYAATIAHAIAAHAEDVAGAIEEVDEARPYEVIGIYTDTPDLQRFSFRVQALSPRHALARAINVANGINPIDAETQDVGARPGDDLKAAAAHAEVRVVSVRAEGKQRELLDSIEEYSPVAS